MAETFPLSSEQLVSLFNLAVDAILIGSTHGEIIFANNQATELSGYDKQELVGSNINIFFSREERERVPLRYDLLNIGKTVRSERILTRKDTSVIPIDMNTKMMPNGTYQTFIRDITERKKTEEALRQSEEKFSKAFKISPDSININRLSDGVYLEINDGFTAMTGYTIQDVVGRSSLPGDLGIWVNAEDRKKLLDTLKVNGEMINFEAEFRKKNKEIIIGSMSARLIEINGEKCILTSTRDITDKQKTEKALLNAQKLESVGLLAGGIAHDFNNLLSGIFGHVDIARMYMQDGNYKRVAVSLSKAMSVFDRAKHLIEQLLTFSKGGIPIRKTQSIVKVVRDSIQFVLSGSTVSPVFDIPNDLWLCDFDANQIAQVIDDITINARQAMPLGGKLTVSITNIGPPNPAPLLTTKSYIRISIRDTGTGIAKEYLPKIFDPFFTTKQQGSGLGLATSYSIINKHEGYISVESELGKGTVFHVFLPAAAGRSATPDNQLHSPHTGRGRILVMDDEAFILDIASQLLEHMGYEVLTVPDGDRAIEAVKQSVSTGHRFIAALLDLTIPGGKGGKEAAAAIISIDNAIITIASSGYSDDPVMANPATYGFATRLVKPYRSEDISQVLELVLKKKDICKP